METLMAIGELARASGIPTDTLRTWERRYGVPNAVRLPSGHRRYPQTDVERLRLVKRALDAGIRAATALTSTPAALLELIAPPQDPSREADPFTGWCELVRHFDDDRFRQELSRSFAAAGALTFIDRVAVPFLRTLGDLWKAGQLRVAHEHFASEQMVDFTRQQWRALSDRATGPRVICAALAGEDHTLAIHLAALLLAVHGFRITFLGRDTPVAEIAAAARDGHARAIVTGISHAAARRPTLQQLVRLVRDVHGACTVVVGSNWTDPSVPVVWVQGYGALGFWAKGVSS